MSEGCRGGQRYHPKVLADLVTASKRLYERQSAIHSWNDPSPTPVLVTDGSRIGSMRNGN